MKFTISSQIFVKAVLAASRLITSAPTNPILVNLKLELSEDGLFVYSSNSEISTRILIPFYLDGKEVIRDYKYGSVLLEGKFLSEIVKRAEGEEVTFEILDGSMARIESETAQYNAPIIRGDEYVDIDFSLTGTKVDITGKDLLDAISQVSFAASVKNSSPILTGVNIECNSTRLIFTATDGARLARKEIMTDTEDVFNITIPSKSLQEVGKSIEGESNVEVYVNDKRILFLYDNTIISSALFSENYRNVKNIIPKNFYYSLEVNSHDFLKALDKVGFASDDRTRVAKLSMSETSVVVSSKSQRGENATDKLSLYRYNGERLEISFNIDYVTQAIRALKSEDVTINFIGEMKPFLIADKNNPNVIQLLTPIRTY